MRLIDWADAPKGTMTNRGELRGELLGKIFVEQVNKHGYVVNTAFDPAGLRLAPAEQQPWLMYEEGLLKQEPWVVREAGKTDTTATLLGYTTKELKSHLEKYFSDGMTWDNYGKGKNQWSIDHTKPISVFNKNASIMEINTLENLRQMWHTQNCSKKNKWEGR